MYLSHGYLSRRLPEFENSKTRSIVIHPLLYKIFQAGISSVRTNTAPSIYVTPIAIRVVCPFVHMSDCGFLTRFRHVSRYLACVSRVTSIAFRVSVLKKQTIHGFPLFSIGFHIT